MHFTPNWDRRHQSRRDRIHGREGAAATALSRAERVGSAGSRDVRDSGERSGLGELQPIDLEFQADVELVWMMPHMHLRGKDMSFELRFPDGRRQMVLSVLNYDFNWQIWYEPRRCGRRRGPGCTLPLILTIRRITETIRTQTKRCFTCDMTWDEMMFPSYGVVVEDKSLDQRKVVKKHCLAAGEAGPHRQGGRLY